MRVLALSAVLLLSMTGVAGGAARPGVLDRGFGGDGRVGTRVPGDPAVVGLERLPRGRLLLVGTVGRRTLLLVRYRRDGSLERRFGHGGVRTVSFDRDLAASDSLIDANGRLLVAGALGEPGTPQQAALLLRFDRAGRFDTTLDGDGISLTDFGSGYGSAATAIALTPAGQIVMAASVGGWDHGASLGVTRLHPSGAIDESFAQRGFVQWDPYFSTDSYTAPAVAVEPSGRAVAAVRFSGKAAVPYLLALLPDGTPDPGFSDYATEPGWRLVPFTNDIDLSHAADLAADPARERIVLTGTSCPEDCQATLPLVSTVGPGAAETKRVIDVHWRGGAYGRAIELDRAGRMIVAGSPNDLAAMFATRMTPAGRPDRCFGRRGVAWAGFGAKGTRVAALALTSDGRIVVAGPDAYMTEPKPRGFQLAAFHGGACPRR